MSNAIETQGVKLGIKAFSGPVSVTFAAGKIVRATGDWTTDFRVGDIVMTGDEDNPGPYPIKAVTATDLTVDGTVTVNAVAASVAISGYAAIGEVTGFDGPGGSATVIDVTSLDSVAKEKMISLPDEGQISFDLNFVPGNRGQVKFRKARRARAKTDFILVFSDGAEDDPATHALFTGFALDFSISGAVDDKVGAKASVEITGAVDWSDEDEE